MIKVLHSENFQPLGPAIRKPVEEKPYIPEQVRPGVFKDQQGRLYTDIATPGVPQVPKPNPLPTLPTLPAVLNALEAGVVYRVTRAGDVGPTYSLWDGKNWECVGDKEEECYTCRCGLSCFQDWQVVA